MYNASCASHIIIFHKGETSKMKKFIAMLLALAMVLAFAGCVIYGQGAA